MTVHEVVGRLRILFLNLVERHHGNQKNSDRVQAWIFRFWYVNSVLGWLKGTRLALGVAFSYMKGPYGNNVWSGILHVRGINKIM